MKFLIILACLAPVFGQNKNLAEVAGDLGLTQLIGVVTGTSIETALSSVGPYTLFGPSDEAVYGVPDDVMMKLGDSTYLEQVLAYHAINGFFYSSNLANDQLQRTLLPGSSVRTNICEKTGKITVNGAVVTDPNNEASNGVLHEINKVLIPPTETIGDHVETGQSITTLKVAIETAELLDVLKGDGPFTLFAPSDDAFAKIPADDLNKLLADKEKLTAVLLNHVVPQTVYSACLYDSQKWETAQGEYLEIGISEDGEVKVNGSKVINADYTVKNGVMHLIDTVIFTPDPESTQETGAAQGLALSSLIMFMGLLATITVKWW